MNDRSAKLLGLLGLGARGGKLVIGVDATRAALQREQARVVVRAIDASPRAMEKVVRLARAKSVPIIAGPTAEAIGTRLGRPPVMMVAVRDRNLAAGLLAAGGGPKDADGGVEW